MPVGDTGLTITLTSNKLHPDDVMKSTTISAHPSLGSEDKDYLLLTNIHRKRIHEGQASPLLSSFVVCCTVVYRRSSSSKKLHTTTANSEPCSLGGSLCAERAALSSLPSLVPDLSQILSVYILSDSPKPITPGFLCREYMNTRFPLRILDPERVKVCLAGTGSDGEVDESSVTSCKLSTFYPAPSLYKGLRVSSYAFVGLQLCQPCGAQDSRLETL